MLQSTDKPLEQIEIFQNLDEATRLELKAKLTQNTWTKGKTIITFGDVGDSIYFLVAGAIEVVSEFGEVIDTAKSPEWFGEVAPFQNVARTASIKAMTDCVTFAISKSDLTAILNRHPDLLRKLDETSRQRMQAYLERSILA
ncbi:cyclic nucleotide-binding-like protein [Entophlyctis helioformis]|nr:cyclic nucleotide-binding-like protein [Entophlyctis helioformis]